MNWKYHNLPLRFSSGHQWCSLKIAVLKNFAKFTGKGLWNLRNFKEHFFYTTTLPTLSVSAQRNNNVNQFKCVLTLIKKYFCFYIKGFICIFDVEECCLWVPQISFIYIWNQSKLSYAKLFNDPLIAQKMKFSGKDLFSKCDQICTFLWIWSHLLKKSLMENFIFCGVPNLIFTKRKKEFFVK